MTGAVLTAEGLNYRFATRDTPAIRDFNCQVHPGEMVLLAGATGSGKTTLLRAIAGIITRHARQGLTGAVSVAGIDVMNASPAQLASRVGLMLQSPDDQICTTTVEAEIAFGLENLACDVATIDARVVEALERAGMSRHRHASTRLLSGGQKQKLVLASIMAMRPQLLLLDEPFSQLDPRAARQLLDELCRLRDEGMAVVVAEHRLDELVTIADRLWVLDAGSLRFNARPADDPRWYEILRSTGAAVPEIAELEIAAGLPATALVVAATAALRNGDRPWEETTGETGAAPSPPSDRDRPATSEPIVRCRGVALRYDRRGPWVLNDVNFELGRGEIVGLVGANGAGKSSLLATLAGIAKPTSGSIDFAQHAASAIALVPQNPDLMLFAATVADELRYGLPAALDAVTVSARIDALIEEFGLAPLLERPPLALSQGQRLRVVVAALLAAEPQLILLDEPTTGQDGVHVRRILQAVSRLALERQASVLMATHDLRVVLRFADRILVLSGGTVIATVTPRQLVDDRELLAAAGLQATPLIELRRQLAMHGLTADELAGEYRTRQRGS